jgi:hypothetical protein
MHAHLQIQLQSTVMDDLAIPLLIEGQPKHNVLPHRQSLAPSILGHIGDPATTITRALQLVHVAQDSRQQGRLASTHTTNHSHELSRTHSELRNVELEATITGVLEHGIALQHTGGAEEEDQWRMGHSTARLQLAGLQWKGLNVIAVLAIP